MPSTPTPASPAPTSARAASSTSTRFNTTDAQLAALAPAAAHRLRRHPLPRLGRQGLGRSGRQPRLGLCARRPHRRGEVDLRHPAARAPGKDRHRQRLGLDVGRPRAPPPLHPGLLARAPTSSRAPCPLDLPVVTSVTALDTDTGAPGLDPPARPPRPLGLRHQRRPDARRHREGRPHHPRPGPDLEAGLPLRPRPHHRRARLPDRGAPGPADRRPRRDSPPPRSPSSTCPERVVPDRWPGVFKLADFVSGGWCSRTAAEPPRRRLLHPAEPQGQPRLPRHRRRHRMGRRRGRPAAPASSSSTTPRAWCRLYRLIPRADYERRRPRRRDRRLLADDRRPLRRRALAPSSTRSACPAGTRPTARWPPTT